MNDPRLRKCGECSHWRFPPETPQDAVKAAGATRPCMEGPPSLYITTAHPITGKPTGFATVPTRSSDDGACGRFLLEKIDS